MGMGGRVCAATCSCLCFSMVPCQTITLFSSSASRLFTIQLLGLQRVEWPFHPDPKHSYMRVLVQSLTLVFVSSNDTVDSLHSPQLGQVPGFFFALLHPNSSLTNIHLDLWNLYRFFSCPFVESSFNLAPGSPHLSLIIRVT